MVDRGCRGRRKEKRLMRESNGEKMKRKEECYKEREEKFRSNRKENTDGRGRGMEKRKERETIAK